GHGMNVTFNPSDKFSPVPPAGVSRNQSWKFHVSPAWTSEFHGDWLSRMLLLTVPVEPPFTAGDARHPWPPRHRVPLPSGVEPRVSLARNKPNELCGSCVTDSTRSLFEIVA